MQYGVCHLSHTCDDRGCPAKNVDQDFGCPADVSSDTEMQRLYGRDRENFSMKNYKIINARNQAAKRISEILFECLLCRYLMVTCTGFSRQEWEKITGRDKNQNLHLSCLEI